MVNNLLSIVSNSRIKRSRAFSLVELLIVIAILAVLVSLLGPNLKQMYRKGQVISCSNQLKQIGLAIFLYVDDYDDNYPANTDNQERGTIWKWRGSGGVNYDDLILINYLNEPATGNRDLVNCPMAPEGTRNDIIYGNSGGTWNSVTYAFFFNARHEISSEFTMRRLGDTWGGKVGSDMLYFNLMASDTTVHQGNGKHRAMNHEPLNWKLDEGTYGGETPLTYRTQNNSYLYPEMDGNFLRDDGSLLYVTIEDGNRPNWQEESEAQDYGAHYRRQVVPNTFIVNKESL
jgi:prepilin-type N-terminal cleavage/methylation domain-containing protein